MQHGPREWKWTEYGMLMTSKKITMRSKNSRCTQLYNNEKSTKELQDACNTFFFQIKKREV